MADKSYAEVLMDMLRSGELTFDWWTKTGTAEIARWRAHRYGDKTLLQQIANWTAARPYKYDPLPKRMSLAFADFMFGEDPVIAPNEETDRESLKSLLRENRFVSKLRTGADICVSEGRVWWRIYVDPLQADAPILDFHSEGMVIPYMIGDTVLACAFVRYFEPTSEGGTAYRHLEVHEEGRVLNFLFEVEAPTTTGSASPTSPNTGIRNTSLDDDRQGGADIGIERPLTDHPLTMNIMEEWNHGLPMLAGRIKNEEDGTSIYQGVEDLLLDLNEAHAIDTENFRLAGKKRAVMNKKYANQAGDAVGGEEIIWVDDDYDELDNDQGPFKLLEYSYDGNSSIARKDDLERIILTRTGLARQLVDANANEGLAQTGTALRTRLLPTISAIKGKTKEWQDNLPYQVMLLQRVDALPGTEFGFERTWSNAEGIPSISLASPLPVDETEEAQRHQTLIAAELESIETAIEELRPGWSKDRRMLEVRRILANRRGFALDDQGNPVTLESRQVPTNEEEPEVDETGGEESSEQPPEGGGETPPSRPSAQGAGVGAG